MKAVAPRIERLYAAETARCAAAWNRYFEECLEAFGTLSKSSVRATYQSLKASLDSDTPLVEASLPRPWLRWFGVWRETLTEALTPAGALISPERLPRPPVEPEGAWTRLAAQTEADGGEAGAARALLALILARGHRAWEETL